MSRYIQPFPSIPAFFSHFQQFLFISGKSISFQIFSAISSIFQPSHHFWGISTNSRHFQLYQPFQRFTVLSSHFQPCPVISSHKGNFQPFHQFSAISSHFHRILAFKPFLTICNDFNPFQPFPIIKSTKKSFFLNTQSYQEILKSTQKYPKALKNTLKYKKYKKYQNIPKKSTKRAIQQIKGMVGFGWFLIKLINSQPKSTKSARPYAFYSCENCLASRTVSFFCRQEKIALLLTTHGVRQSGS